MIRFDHVSKQYGKHAFALSDITVTISDGEFIFLIGPSGAGKTTLLRLLLHDILPSEGNITVDELDLNELRKHEIYLLRRKIGMIFQDFKLLTDRTVYENVAITLEILGKNDSEIKKGVMDILDLVGLPEKANFFPLQLSAGELQRTSIARAVAGGPKILLADEPTGNLDPETSLDILSILSEIQEIGTTIIMATHNVGIVNEMKKRTITIVGGKIASDEEKGTYTWTPRNRKQKDTKHQNHDEREKE